MCQVVSGGLVGGGGDRGQEDARSSMVYRAYNREEKTQGSPARELLTKP